MEKGNVIIYHHVNFDDNIFPYKDITSSKKGSLYLLFHECPDPPSDLSTFFPSNLPSETRKNSLIPPPIETENILSTSSSIPLTDLAKYKAYAWVSETSNSN
ncbi:hypothetical protein O181_002351 [Austropuccinia psidii MF-1]|uniref:Uncharacterized protein n=1 Tax=Austropuccinia psidii MF-1 TaxID=1389203 RepID=A0A9Q3BCU4_9BASI|nr:hypothetical protein [Austropuccinia psidii MF-1]